MTNQQIFNKVAKHLLKQGRRARDGNGCAYRGENGTKCAVGCLIPDALYDDRLEGSSVRYVGDGCYLLGQVLVERFMAA